MTRHRRRSRLLIAIVASLFFAVLVLPLGWRSWNAFAEDRYADLQLFSRVLNLVQQYYVEPVDVKKLLYGGIRGILRELDPHTSFLPPDLFKEFETETTGEFGGLGIEITLQAGVLTVISPIEDTPAWAAGIQPGDRIVAINGEPTKGLSLAEAAQKMRGKMGSKVRMMIYRDGFDQPREFVIARGTVKLKSVKYTDLLDGYGYLRLTGFMDRTAKELATAIEKHQKANKEVRGLIMDLRKNPGGLMEQAVQVADLFLEQGVIVSTVGRNQKQKEIVYAKKPGTLPAIPLVVLIDEYSASASEIVAGALKDNRRALIMGQQSFGKGSVQSVVKLGDGSGLKLTVARYFTPSGRSIQAEGIMPDILLEDISPEALDQIRQNKVVRRESDMKNHLPSEKELEQAAAPKDSGTETKPKKLSPSEELLGKDFQILQAYNYLKAWKTLGLMVSQQSQLAPAAVPTGSAEEGR